MGEIIGYFEKLLLLGRSALKVRKQQKEIAKMLISYLLNLTVARLKIIVNG